MGTKISEDTKAKIAASWREFLDAVAAGELLKDVRARYGFSEGELRAYRALVPGAQAEWELARETSADAFADEALATARSRSKDQTEAADARTRIDTLKWAARMRNPRAYSDKQAIDLNVKTVDLTRIIQDANARLAAARQVGRIVEGAVITQALPQAIEDLI